MLSVIQFEFVNPNPVDTPSVTIMELLESKVSLEDGYWQLFTEPEELTLLNINMSSKFKLPLPNEKGSPWTLWLTLSKELSIEGRVVTSFPVLFGDISGLKDFFNFLIVFVIGSSQAKFYQYDLLKTFFRYGNPDCEDGIGKDLPGMTQNVSKTHKKFSKLNLSLFEKFKLMLLSFCLSKRS